MNDFLLEHENNIDFICPNLEFELLKEMHDVLVSFNKNNHNISLETMSENDGKYTEFSYWIGEMIIKQEEFLEIEELSFDHMSKNIESLLISGTYDTTLPKMTITDAKRNAPMLLKNEKIRIIKIKSFLKRLKNINDTLFKAINTNARFIRLNEKIH